MLWLLIFFASGHGGERLVWTVVSQCFSLEARVSFEDRELVLQSWQDL